MSRILKLITLITSLLALSSCVDGDLTTTKADMGTMMDGYVQSDYGYKITFKASEITFDKSVVTKGTRLYLTYQYTLSETTSTEVKATLMSYKVFPVSEIIRESEVTPEIGSDAIYVKGDSSTSGGSIWASGGYINAEFKFFQARNSSTVHDISLVYLESESQDGNYVFELRHNAHGETLGYQGYTTSNTEMVSGFNSYNYLKAIGGDVKSITVKYRWYKDSEFFQDLTLEEGTASLSITEPI